MTLINANHLILDKKAVIKAFERAAIHYDDVSVVSQETNKRMASRLDYMTHFTPAYILDAGSGTGFAGSLLQQRYSDAVIIEADMALSMLQQSRSLSAGMLKRLVNADIEKLPFADSSINMVWSNLALPWLNVPSVAFKEFYRVLAPDGLLMFSALGPKTFKELKTVWPQIDDVNHAYPFMSLYDWGDLLLQAGFSAPVMDVESIVLTYQDISTMMHELKNSGASNLGTNRCHTLMGKAKWQAFCKHYEAFREKGRLPITYEIIYGMAWRDH